MNKSTRSKRSSKMRSRVLNNNNPIPNVPGTIRHSQTFRWTVTDPNPLIIVLRSTLLNLLAQAGNAGSGLQWYRQCESVRIKEVNIYGVTQPGQICTADLTWIGGEYGINVSKSGSGSNDQMLHIKSRPPPNTSAAFWSTSGNDESNQIFSIVYQSNLTNSSYVVDITFDLLFNTTATVLVTPTPFAPPTSGQIGFDFVIKLDGTGPSTPIYIPVGFSAYN
jgi:hypothetical protein